MIPHAYSTHHLYYKQCKSGSFPYNQNSLLPHSSRWCSFRNRFLHCFPASSEFCKCCREDSTHWQRHRRHKTDDLLCSPCSLAPHREKQSPFLCWLLDCTPSQLHFCKPFHLDTNRWLHHSQCILY